MRIKAQFKLVASLILLLVLVLSFFNFRDMRLSAPAQGFQSYRLVSHAMGGIDGVTYSNTYEAFAANYKKGIRVFEADLLLSKDGHLIARHEWGESFTKLMGQQDGLEQERWGSVWTLEEFKSAKVMGKYEPLDWDDILDLMTEYPDIYLVSDTKQISEDEIDEIFGKIVSTAQAREQAESLLDRIVPQIYYESMWDAIHEIYPFSSVIYTLYQTHDSDDKVVSFAKEKGISAITMSTTRANKELVAALMQAGIPSYVHTINDPKEVLKFKRMGVYGFYSDFLGESDTSRTDLLYLLGL